MDVSNRTRLRLFSFASVCTLILFGFECKARAASSSCKARASVGRKMSTLCAFWDLASFLQNGKVTAHVRGKDEGDQASAKLGKLSSWQTAKDIQLWMCGHFVEDKPYMVVLLFGQCR